jgi:riboflavin kinase/FMN adenylyltransferase
VGIPPANLRAYSLLPPNGVYLTLAETSGRVFPALTDIGVRPTVESEGELRAETHIPDFSGNIYDEEMTLTFVRRLREERAFPSADALWAQVERDLAAFRAAVESGELPRPYRINTKTDFREEF